jgi:hypothetical protein
VAHRLAIPYSIDIRGAEVVISITGAFEAQVEQFVVK